MRHALSLGIALLAGCLLGGWLWNPARQELASAAPQAEGAPPAIEPPPLDGRDGRDLLLRLFRPEPQLRVAAHDLPRAKFPVVDAHTHFRYRLHHSPEQLDEYVALMDRGQIAVCVSLDGRLGEELDEHLGYLERYADRFVVFANVDWQGDGRDDEPATWDCQRPDFARRTAETLRAARDRGACGLKVFKDLGLRYRNPDGSQIAVDDPRWDPIWEACGELGLPVLIHTADPVAFFEPLDETNERWEELYRHPEWRFPAGEYPSHADLTAALLRVVARHPRTNFVAAHVASHAEDLAAVAGWLDAHPNLYLDIASRISELGRQPYTARDFCLKYSDRILFATDGPWPEARVQLYWRFLETRDEYFPYSEKDFPPQGLWRIYGLDLPDDVLRRIYSENAARLIPGVRERLEKFAARS